MHQMGFTHSSGTIESTQLNKLGGLWVFKLKFPLNKLWAGFYYKQQSKSILKK